MDRDNISALAMAIAVVAVIVGFGVYFNSPGLNKASSLQQQLEKVVSATTDATNAINGTTPNFVSHFVSGSYYQITHEDVLSHRIGLFGTLYWSDSGQIVVR
jgi:predicted PurR-regulated permease PerM